MDEKNSSPGSSLPADSRVLPLLGSAHDANQMLSVVVGRTDLLLQSDGLARQHRCQLEAIATAARDAVDLLTAALDGDAGGRGEDATELDLASTVRDCWQASVAYLRATGSGSDSYRYREEFPDSADIVAPPLTVRRVVTNILINALQAMPHGGEVVVRGGCDGDQVTLAIRDRGPGLDAPTLARLFQLGVTGGKPSGHGVGLASSRRLLRELGGDLTAESTPHEGTTLRVSLPRTPRSTAGPCGTSPGADEPRLAGRERADGDSLEPVPSLSVLIVENEITVQEMLVEMLEADNHRSRTAIDAASALAMFAPNRYHLALLDYGLPGISGVALAERLRAQDQRLVIALVSGWGSEAVSAAADPATVDLRETKPLDVAKVRSLLARAARIVAGRTQT